MPTRLFWGNKVHATRRDSAYGTTAKESSLTRWSDAAALERQLRLVDLIPQRRWLLALWFVLLSGVIAGLTWLYAWMPQLAAMTKDGRVAAFDLDGEGSLASWYSSALLAMASVVALIIYGLRRHRLDDYRGRYRIWLWASLILLLASIDVATSLHAVLRPLMTALTGTPLYGDGSIWSVVVIGTLVALCLTRMAFEMW